LNLNRYKTVEVFTLKMKFNLAQKIGAAGIGFILIVSVIFYLGDYFSPFIFIGTIPFCMLILIGYSVKNGQKRIEK